MIALKVPADAAHHPYQLVDILASTGTKVAKGDPVFKLSRAGSQRNTTFRAPVAGTIGRYLIMVGTDLLSEPGQHVVTLERAESETSPDPQTSTDTVSDVARADRVEMLLPNDPEVLPARIDAWLVNVGEAVALDQQIAQITLADGRRVDLTSKAAGRLASVAAQEGEYITQMRRLCCTIVQDSPQDAQIVDPIDFSKTTFSAPASEPPQKTAPYIVCGPDAPENYPMQLVEWHVKEGDFVGKGQVLMTLRRASGHASVLRSIEAGRILSTHVAAGTEFGISDVLYALSTAEIPPAGWTMPPDPPIDTAPAKSAFVTTPTPELQSSPDNVEPKVQASTTQEAARIKKRRQERLERRQPGAESFGLVTIVLLVPIAVAMSYLFTGSRVIGAGSTAVVLLMLLMFTKGTPRLALGGVLFAMSGLLMLAPQNVVLPAKITPWEPFVSIASSPDGAWHGDIWENITRPRPTKQQQARFDAWLEE